MYKKRPGKQETHRALADVRESIAELAYYRAEMLRPATSPPIVGSASSVPRSTAGETPPVSPH